MNKKEVTPNMEIFFKEYKDLCEKRGCFLISEGEEVWLIEDREEMKATNYWNVVGTTRERAYLG